MREFPNGVSYYTKGTYELTVNFPEDDVCCFRCWMRFKDSGDRQMCRLLNTELYSVKNMIHEDCPLRFKEDSE